MHCWPTNQLTFIYHWNNRTIVDLEKSCVFIVLLGRSHVSNTRSVAIGMSNKNHLMAQSNQMLRKTPNVILNASKSRKEKIRHKGNPVFSAGGRLGSCGDSLHGCIYGIIQLVIDRGNNFNQLNKRYKAARQLSSLCPCLVKDAGFKVGGRGVCCGQVAVVEDIEKLE